MLTRTDARLRAQRHLDSIPMSPNDSIIILDDYTIEKDYGWIFSYNSRRYVEEGALSHALAGNGPIVVMRQDGAIHELSGALPLEQAIADFEAVFERR